MVQDSKILLTLNDRIVAEEIRNILEESQIYVLLRSDNPASSVMGAIMGSAPSETIKMIVNVADYEKAIEILLSSKYKDLFPGN
jgi:hypothetical protein